MKTHIRFFKTLAMLWVTCLLVFSSGGTGEMTNRPVARPMPAGKALRSATTPVQMVKQSLSQTDEQAKKLEPVLKKQREKINALRRDTSLSRQDRVARLKEIGGMSDSKIKPLLTPEQVQKWQSSRTNLQQLMRQDRAAGTNQVITAEKVAAWQKLNSSRQALPQRQESSK